MSAPILQSGAAFYPTPPPSPDLDEVDVSTLASLMFKQPEVVLTAGPLSPPLETISGFSNTPLATPPLEDAPLTSPIVEYPAPVFSGQTPPLPIPLLLNTAHHLPFASSFRLTSPTNILATLGGNRVLELDVSQSLWDRMPYSAANAAAMVTTADANDEEQIETLLFADKPEARIRGFHWALRNHKWVIFGAWGRMRA